jgi:hypothetical protein
MIIIKWIVIRIATHPGYFRSFESPADATQKESAYEPF